MSEWVKNIKDPEMKKVVEMANNIAVRKATVLITGESGVGKELMARYIHEMSHRKDHAFVATNCAAVPENLLESELFGYEKGAFTGAQTAKPGKVEAADKGTFLLDEISEMPLALQGKLLRVLQESEVERLGATQPKKVDVRFICTTNRSLAEMVKKGEFRQDLFYRLNVIPLNIPTLRARKKDLNSLVQYFLGKVAMDNKMRIKEMSVDALQKIHNWSWPGNVRELQNVIERSCLMSSADTLMPEDIKIETTPLNDSAEVESGLVTTGMTIQEAERRLILKTLEYTGENRTQAAKILGISIRTLRNKLNEYKSTSRINL
jgi:transcriptional regulator with PAS, ATPase and Fis domain